MNPTNGFSRLETGEFLVGKPLASPKPRDWRSLLAQMLPHRAPRPPTVPKYAAIVFHGMGQQTKFETLDMLAQGVARAAAGEMVNAPVARIVSLGEELRQRLEVTLKTDGGERELHLYEGYWAPITEGRVKLHDVIHLLFLAITNGVRNGTTEFRRWLFGHYVQFPPQIRTLTLLLIGLAAVLSLIVINVAIGLVATTRWTLGIGQTVIGDGLYGDLSTVLNILFVFLVIFVVALGLHRWSGVGGARASVKKFAGGLSFISFVVTLAVTVAVGLAIPLLFYLHRLAGAEDKLPLLPAAVSLGAVDRFNDWVELYVLGFAVALFFAAACELVFRIGRGLIRSFRGGDDLRWLSVALLVFVSVVTLALLAEAFWLGLRDWGLGVRNSTVLERGAVWALLVLASLWIRRVLVQYVGDVVAYVQSYAVDRFDELRNEIKDKMYKQALAVYNLRNADGELEYSDVAVVGHSLGSVIAYDTLNRLINEDALAEGNGSNGHVSVVDRTCLLLTFGSPLDKTAFLFGAQRKQTKTRSALAATVQPLIQRPEWRPPWVNVYSCWDPISAALKFYDPPHLAEGKPHPKAVENKPDPQATTLFLAHTEYWHGQLIFKELLDALPWRVGHAQRASDETSCPHPALPVASGTTGLERI